MSYTKVSSTRCLSISIHLRPFHLKSLFGFVSTLRNKSPFTGSVGHAVPNVADPLLSNGSKLSACGLSWSSTFCGVVGTSMVFSTIFSTTFSTGTSTVLITSTGTSTIFSTGTSLITSRITSTGFSTIFSTTFSTGTSTIFSIVLITSTGFSTSRITSIGTSTFLVLVLYFTTGTSFTTSTVLVFVL